MIYASFTLKPEGVGLENSVSGLYVADIAIPCAIPIAKKYNAEERHSLHLSLMYSLGQLLSSVRTVDLVKTQERFESILNQISACEAEIEWTNGWSKTYTSSDGVVKLTYSVVGVDVYGEPLNENSKKDA